MACESLAWFLPYIVCTERYPDNRNDNFITLTDRRLIMSWNTPEYSDIRFGFEVTMYINNK